MTIHAGLSRLHFTSLEAGWSGATAGGKRPLAIREDAETLLSDAKQPGIAQDQGSGFRPVKLVTAPGVRGRTIVRRASNRSPLSRKRHARAGVVPGDAARQLSGKLQGRETRRRDGAGSHICGRASGLQYVKAPMAPDRLPPDTERRPARGASLVSNPRRLRELSGPSFLASTRLRRRTVHGRRGGPHPRRLSHCGEGEGRISARGR